MQFELLTTDGAARRGRLTLAHGAIETPVFSIAPEVGGNFGKLQWFSSTYRPLILSVRFLFLRYPKGFACVPVKNNGFEKSKVVNPSYDRK